MGSQIKKGALSRCLGGLIGLFLMLGSAAAHALTLGEIEIHSRLGEPLKATIPVAGSQADLHKLEVAMAYPSVYESLGIEQSRVLEKLQIILVKNSGKPRIEVTSTDVVKEPMFTFVLTADWGSTRINRPYAVFLSP
jgi:pilus assembly protein FimV